MYHVLRTIDTDGNSLTHLPTDERIVESTEVYGFALHTAKTLRNAKYRHYVTGEERTYTELDIVGCAYHEDQTVWEFTRQAEYIPGGYAIVVEAEDLRFYEPKEN